MSLPLSDTGTKLLITRTFNARRDRVFRAWTDPHLIAQWLGGENYTAHDAHLDLRVGGMYRVEMRPPIGAHFFIVGEYQEIDFPEKLVFTWQFEGDGPVDSPTLVTVSFVDRDTRTEVTLYHERFPDIPTRDMHSQGWLLCFDRIENLL